LSNNKDLIVGHATQIYGPVQALIRFFIKRKNTFSTIIHSLPSYSSTYSSEWTVFCQGREIEAKKYNKVKLADLLAYFQDAIFTFYLVLRSRNRYDTCVGIDNANAFCGIILKKLGLVRKVIFYVIDYSPKRFESQTANYLYHLSDLICARYSDYVWNISKRIYDMRQRQGVQSFKNRVVPVGIELDRIAPSSESDREPCSLVFVSHLTKSKGIDLMIDAMEDLVKTQPNLTLEIIGDGPYKASLMDRVDRLKLQSNVKFSGLIDHDSLMRYLPTRGIGIATYVDDPNNISYYADPTKPKEYLACGLPVIITKVPWIAEEIQNRPMGIAIRYDKSELERAILSLVKDTDFYSKCRRNALIFASGLDWDDIYENAVYASRVQF
jgi:glycosyltransferase involved in cell wall biosynthesis